LHSQLEEGLKHMNFFGNIFNVKHTLKVKSYHSKEIPAKIKVDNSKGTN